MKIRLFIAAVLLLGMSSCAYKICPTYAQNEDAKIQSTLQAASQQQETEAIEVTAE